MIQHQINHDAGYRDIQPHRQGESRNSLMSFEVAALRAPHGNNYEGDDHRRQNGVSKQNRKIDGPRNSLPGKPGSAMMRVIGQVRDKKQHRHGERRDLAIPMRLNPFVPDKEVAAD